MSRKPLERGAYRSISEVIVDGPDFQALSFDAQGVWFHLKMALGACGIAVFYPVVLPEKARDLTMARVEAGLAELRQGGWIRSERNVYWLVGGLYRDPHLVVTHPKHRAGVQKHVKGLPNLPIVEEFKTYYREWFEPIPTSKPQTPATPTPEESDDDSGEATDSLSEGYPKATDSHSDQRRQKTEDRRRKRETDQTTSCDESHAEGVTPISAAPSARAKKDPEPDTAMSFQAFKEAYPRRKGGYNWKEAEKRFGAIVKKGEATGEQLVAAVNRYRLDMKELGNVGGPHVLMASSFLGGRHLEYLDGGEPSTEDAALVAANNATWDSINW